MLRCSKRKHKGLTLVEVVVALGVMALSTVAMTHAMLVMNQNAAMSRVRNLAKTKVLERIQEVSTVAYDPTAKPPVVPSILVLGTRTETVQIDIAEAKVPSIPSTVKWVVGKVNGSDVFRAVTCSVEYYYLGRKQTYEVITFRSPD
ncbi:MAG: hypothetical protein EOP84_01835 [Verrucomicrobiaceae bacterium]|nr:MAG: hypothetical protein EOP84_01835 [Verrucomicrobiaceae bacterium]